MIRFLVAALVLSAPLAAGAQQAGPLHSPEGHHAMHGALPGARPGAAPAGTPTEPGQGAFAAIQEIVAFLMADPKTDWSKVDIDGLRRHLVDMNNVTLYAAATATPIPNGLRFTVTGDGPVRASIRRMVPAHAMTMSGRNGMTMVAGDHPDGATLSVTLADPADLPKLEGLGFFGLLTVGMHHQAHHLALASGTDPHRH